MRRQTFERGMVGFPESVSVHMRDFVQVEGVGKGSKVWTVMARFDSELTEVEMEKRERGRDFSVPGRALRHNLENLVWYALSS